MLRVLVDGTSIECTLTCQQLVRGYSCKKWSAVLKKNEDPNLMKLPTEAETRPGVRSLGEMFQQETPTT